MQACRSQLKHKLSPLNCRSTAHSLDPPFLKVGGVNFDYLPRRGGSEKLKKLGGSIVQGQIFLKEGGGNCSYLMLSKFVIFTFTNYFTLYKIVSCICRLFSLFALFYYCYYFFPASIILWKKVILSCLKMDLKISHKSR